MNRLLYPRSTRIIINRRAEKKRVSLFFNRTQKKINQIHMLIYTQSCYFFSLYYRRLVLVYFFKIVKCSNFPMFFFLFRLISDRTTILKKKNFRMKINQMKRKVKKKYQNSRTKCSCNTFDDIFVVVVLDFE